MELAGGDFRVVDQCTAEEDIQEEVGNRDAPGLRIADPAAQFWGVGIGELEHRDLKHARTAGEEEILHILHRERGPAFDLGRGGASTLLFLQFQDRDERIRILVGAFHNHQQPWRHCAGLCGE